MAPDKEQMAPDTDMEDYARDCVRLAGLTDNQQLREQLLQLAREWMAASMGEAEVPDQKPMPPAQ
jgi:hypothetical protein